MDPNQRQMLEVVYEGLENAGLPLEQLNSKPIACFVGAYSSDYGDMQNRDPKDRLANNTIGIGRAIIAYSQYDFTSIDPKSLVDVQTQNESNRNSSYHLIDAEKESLGLTNSIAYDPMIVKAAKNLGVGLHDDTQNLKPLLAAESYTIIVRGDTQNSIHKYFDATADANRHT